MTLSFDTLAEYQAAKQQGGEIYEAVIASERYTATAVSYIASLGRSVIDGKNVIVARSQGQPGDVLLWRTADAQFFWLKSYVPVSAWDAAYIGQLVCDTTQLASAGYVPCGVMLYRVGRRAAVLSLSDVASAAWGPASLVPDVATFPTITRADGAGVESVSLNLYQAEKVVSAVDPVLMPVLRSDWDAMVSAALQGLTASGSFTGGGWSTAGGVASLTFTLGTEQKTIDPAIYDFCYDDFYLSEVVVRPDLPLAGPQNTGAAVFMASAAFLCASYGIVSIPDLAPARWWLPSIGDFCHTLPDFLSRKGTLPSGTLWSSDQVDASRAWAASLQGAIGFAEDKTAAHGVRALTNIQI